MIAQLNERTLSFVTGRRHSLCTDDMARESANLKDAICNASVLAIGGAGSIGSAFLRELLKFRPRRVVVLDINENALTELIRDLRSTSGQFVPDDFVTYPIGFSDPIAARIIDSQGPFDIVANFAAHKHVRSEKDMFSIEAMFENNAFRAQALLERFCSTPPHHFFCVSTDKAANPANLMGASKKLMEMLLLAYASRLTISTARFANVAFSNGSLLDGFRSRFARGQPISAPSDVRRYFVTNEESGQICLLAGIRGGAGEILFPKLDLSLNTRTFAEIADAMLADLGLRAHRCESESEARDRAARRRPDDPTYPVYYFTSDTTGEKPVEEFYSDRETVDLDRFTALGVVTADRVERSRIDEVFRSLRSVFADMDTSTQLSRAKAKEALISQLREVFEGFDHVETGKYLDQKM